ncbi:MAG TPA: class I SAM-dependent methyltransferase [Candidatus Stackebrandtia excrementipullorum]|nr:class I SAM-dependent methyltransferase [Candidatus Stackebrandtia excrementipullorum]
MPDPIFADPLLASIYDPLDPDRSDLAPYAAMVTEFGASSLLDVGCGTGTFACLLARRGIKVTGVDPAEASLDVARTKPGADAVTWLHGDATTLPPMQVDMATMTANVAQVFLTDEAWTSTLEGIHAALRPGGRLVFETRVPSLRLWENWTRENTHKISDLDEVGRVESWCQLQEVSSPLVTFRWTYVLHADGRTLVSDSTLRFRERDEIVGHLTDVGFTVDDVRDTPDRPGREYVFVASKTGAR